MGTCICCSTEGETNRKSLSKTQKLQKDIPKTLTARIHSHPTFNFWKQSLTNSTDSSRILNYWILKCSTLLNTNIPQEIRRTILCYTFLKPRHDFELYCKLIYNPYSELYVEFFDRINILQNQSVECKTDEGKNEITKG